MIYYFKGNTAGEKRDDFDNGIKLFEKNKISWNEPRRSEKARNGFKLKLNKLLRGRYKAEEQKTAYQNIKFQIIKFI